LTSHLNSFALVGTRFDFVAKGGVTCPRIEPLRTIASRRRRAARRKEQPRSIGRRAARHRQRVTCRRTRAGKCGRSAAPSKEPPSNRIGRAKEMGAGIAASPHCAERRICRSSRTRSREIHFTSPGSPAQASLSIRQLPPCGGARPSTRPRRPKARSSFDYRSPDPKVKTVRRSAALLGMIPSASRFARPP
jgi:hypothetical protein